MCDFFNRNVHKKGLSKKSLSCHPGLDPGSHPKPIINTWPEMADQVRHDKAAF